ncbi:hypothetical protein M2366_002319 [Aeromonas sp. BIGb0405]|nr:hypothetical protein [Aeromonas sp. BIGb0405]
MEISGRYQGDISKIPNGYHAVHKGFFIFGFDGVSLCVNIEILIQ